MEIKQTWNATTQTQRSTALQRIPEVYRNPPLDPHLPAPSPATDLPPTPAPSDALWRQRSPETIYLHEDQLTPLPGGAGRSSASYDRDGSLRNGDPAGTTARKGCIIDVRV